MTDHPGVDTSIAIREKLVLAPMVRGSELSFRALVRKHGASLCYSPMLRAIEVVRAYQQWKEELSDKNPTTTDVVQQHHEDGWLLIHDVIPDTEPLVVQLCGNCPDTLYAATKALLEIQASQYTNTCIQGIDLNLGCPQKCASNGCFGAFLAEDHPDLAVQCVAAMRRAMDEFQFPGDDVSIVQVRPRLSCKIRLLGDDDGHDETVCFAQRLVSAGCELLAVHCRRRLDKHDSLPDLETGKIIVDALSIPVVINGNVYSLEDAKHTLARTKAHAVMVASGFLQNPQLLVVRGQVDPAELAVDYLEYAERYPPPSPLYIRRHLRWIFRSKVQPATRPRYPDDYIDWRPRLWSFLVRPYLETIDQFRQVVALYVKLSGSEMPPSLRNLPEPSFQSIRHQHGGAGGVPQEEEQDTINSLDECPTGLSLVSLFE